MKSILDPSFRYVPSSATDLRKTFARVPIGFVNVNADQAKCSLVTARRA